MEKTHHWIFLLFICQMSKMLKGVLSDCTLEGCKREIHPPLLLSDAATHEHWTIDINLMTL